MNKTLSRAICAAMALAAYPASGIALTEDKPATVDGIQAVCTGVGSDKSDSRWTSFPVKLVFANRRGQYIAGENIDIREGGRSVLRAKCDGPWLLLRPTAGRYHVSATLNDHVGTRRASGTFSTSGEGMQKTITLEFPVGQSG